MDEKLLIENLYVSYGKKEILNNINLDLINGEFTVLVGLNGAGKTTLLKSIVGLIPSKSGKIKFGQSEITKLKNKELGKLISYIPQNIHSNQSYYAEDIILMGITPYLSMFEVPNEEHYKLVDNVLKELNIEHLKGKTIAELSGGERRLVYLGRILIQKCKILLLDEPNTFLDYVKQYDFFSFLKNLIKDKNLISLITLHDINLALRYADRIIVLNQNNIVGNIDCKKSGYEKKLVEVMKSIYKKDLSIIQTEVGPMIIC